MQIHICEMSDISQNWEVVLIQMNKKVNFQKTYAWVLVSSENFHKWQFLQNYYNVYFKQHLYLEVETLLNLNKN